MNKIIFLIFYINFIMNVINVLYKHQYEIQKKLLIFKKNLNYTKTIKYYSKEIN